MWHRGEINIAQEHLATAITMQMMDRQRQAAKPRTPIGLRALVTPPKTTSTSSERESPPTF